MPWEKVTLVGVGLLGGSLGKALRTRGLANSVVGLVRREATISEAVAGGAVDSATLDIEEAVSGADLIVLCTPLGAMAELLRQMLPFLAPQALVTDVGSAKGLVSSELEQVLADHSASFVGSHPMAGAEKGGVCHAKAELLKGALCVVTPTKNSSPEDVAHLSELWEKVGCRVLELDPSTHDEIVSRSSHLPHIVAAALASYVLDPEATPEQARVCASGFRDTTRVAAGDVTMWRDILRQNSAAITGALDDYLEELKRFRDAVAQQNDEQIGKLLERARERRLNWDPKSANSTTPPIADGME